MFLNNEWYFVWCADYMTLIVRVKVCACIEHNTVGIHTLIKYALLQIKYNL